MSEHETVVKRSRSRSRDRKENTEEPKDVVGNKPESVKKRKTEVSGGKEGKMMSIPRQLVGEQIDLLREINSKVKELDSQVQHLSKTNTRLDLLENQVLALTAANARILELLESFPKTNAQLVSRELEDLRVQYRKDNRTVVGEIQQLATDIRRNLKENRSSMVELFGSNRIEKFESKEKNRSMELDDFAEAQSKPERKQSALFVSGKAPPKDYWTKFPKTEKELEPVELTSNVLYNIEQAEQRLGLDRNGGKAVIMAKDRTIVATEYQRIVRSDHGAYIEVKPEHIVWKAFQFKGKESTGFSSKPYYYKYFGYRMSLYLQIRTVADRPNPPSGIMSVRRNRSGGYADYKWGFVYLDCLQIRTRQGIWGKAEAFTQNKFQRRWPLSNSNPPVPRRPSNRPSNSPPRWPSSANSPNSPPRWPPSAKPDSHRQRSRDPLGHLGEHFFRPEERRSPFVRPPPERRPSPPIVHPERQSQVGHFQWVPGRQNSRLRSHF